MTAQPSTDQVLRAWLSAGAEGAPEDAVLAVLERVQSVPQRRAPLAWPSGDRSPTHRLAAFAAAGVVAVAIGLGIGIQAGLIRLPTVPEPPIVPDPSPRPRESAEPEASEAPDAVEPATRLFATEGFELTPPEGWTLLPALSETFAAVHDDGTSVDGFVGELDGTLEVCTEVGEPTERCWSKAPASLDAFTDAVLTDPTSPDIAYVILEETATDLAGDPARLVRVRPAEGGASSDVAFVTALHEGRPFLLRFRAEGPIATSAVEDFVDGLGFLSRESVLYTNLEDGYEVLLPEWWERTAHRWDLGVTFFGNGGGAGTSGGPGLVISVGQPDGTVELCSGTCETVHVASLAELEEAIVSSPPAICRGLGPDCGRSSEQRGDLTLAGAQARFESASLGGRCLGCPDAWRHVFAIVDGRPVVLAFDYWNIRFNRFSWYSDSADWVDEIVDSFRFVDAATSVEMVTYADRDAGYSVSHPATWVAGQSDAGTRTFQASRAGSRLYELRITVGDADGNVRLCILTCVDATGITSLEELSDALHSKLLFGPARDTSYGPIYLKPFDAVHGKATLDGEDARTEQYESVGCCPPRGYYAVYTIHDGRPVVLAFDPGTSDNPSVADETIEAVVASFRFTDG
jgi:hypothetical protein